MIVVDLNILIYAINRDVGLHTAARSWWEARLSGRVPVGLAWTVIQGFVRLTTHPSVMPHPLTPDQAFSVVDGWLEQPCVRIAEPTERHWSIFKNLLAPLGVAGNLTSDAHLAALAIERGALLCSTDRDFARFPGLRWENPLA